MIPLASGCRYHCAVPAKTKSDHSGELRIPQPELPFTDPERIYNAAADHYDSAPLGFWNRYGRATVGRLDLRSGARVLDVACGSGASAIPAAEAVGADGRVTAVDLADDLLGLARAKAEMRKLANIDFITADMTSLGYPDETFDAVICVFGVYLAPDMEGLVAELWRMLRPRGKLAITTWGPRTFEPMYSAWNEALRFERPGVFPPVPPWDRIAAPGRLTQLFTDAGIPRTEVTPESGSQQLKSPTDWWSIVLGSGLRGEVEAMGPEAAARVRSHNIFWARQHSISAIETNVIYAASLKPGGQSAP